MKKQDLTSSEQLRGLGKFMQITIPETAFEEISEILTDKLEARLIPKLITKIGNHFNPAEKPTVYLTRREACERIKMSLVTLDYWINNGRLKTSKIGRRVLISENDLNEFVKQYKQYKGDDGDD